MNKTLILLTIIALLASCNSYKKLTYLRNLPETQNDSLFPRNKETYRIQPADILYIQIITPNEEINQLFNPNFSQNRSNYQAYREEGMYYSGYTVDDSGYISLPVIDKVNVMDLTVKQAEDTVASRADEYLKNAQIIVKLGSFRFTILGEVNSPGIKRVHDDQVNILEALAYGGDITYNGNRQNILIVRPTKDGSRTLRVDATDNDLIRTKEYYILPNDIIYVEPLRATLFRERTQDYLFVVTSISTVLSTLLLVLTITGK